MEGHDQLGDLLLQSSGVVPDATLSYSAHGELNDVMREHEVAVGAGSGGPEGVTARKRA